MRSRANLCTKIIDIKKFKAYIDSITNNIFSRKLKALSYLSADMGSYKQDNWSPISLTSQYKHCKQYQLVPTFNTAKIKPTFISETKQQRRSLLAEDMVAIQRNSRTK